MTEREKIVRYIMRHAEGCLRMADRCRSNEDRKTRLIRAAILAQVAHEIEGGDHLATAPAAEAD